MESSQTTTTNISENKEGNYKGHGKYRGGSGYYNKYRGNRNQGFENEDGTEGRSFNKTKFYNKFPKKNYHGREMVDPYTSQMIIYRAEMYILTKYPALIDLNVRNDNITNFIDERSQFFIIKSFSEEDVHKSIKYNVWSSTKTGNQTLNSAFKLTKENGGNVYLFFSCNGSGRYIGLARMKNEVNETKQFMYWTQDSKWPGLFDVDWIFIKDVPFKNFKHICITMKDGQVKPISNARDTQEIPFNEGKNMVEIIETFSNTNTLLEHFEYYDWRQENYDKNYNPA